MGSHRRGCSAVPGGSPENGQDVDARCPTTSYSRPVIEVKVTGDHGLLLRFSDGTEGEIDLSGELEGPVFEPLKDPAYFAKATLHHELGTVVWPNGADFAPEFLHDRARVPA